MEQNKQNDEKLRHEVINLREYVFNEKQVESSEEEEIDVSSVQEVQQKKLNIALFGGHLRFVQKMKEVFPNIRTVSPDELNIDISFVNQMDVILFDTSYNNHSNYYRLQQVLKPELVKLIFINREKSIERIATNILRKFND